MHVMGTFHKHHVAGAGQFLKLFRRFPAGIAGMDHLHASFFRAFGKETGKRAYCDKAVKSDFRCRKACFIMALFLKAAQFAHISHPA